MKEEEKTEDYIKSIFKQVLLAISIIHERDIIHRDIKMENFVFETMAKDSSL